MTQRSLFWDGEVLGDCGPYGMAHVDDQFFRSVLNGTGNRGVLKNWLNELEVTGTSSPVSIASGGAVVYGGLYENTVATTFAVSTPSSGYSRIDRIVIQRRWSTQVTRVAKVTGTAALNNPAAPALTQTPDSLYEIPLAQVLITDNGDITITDEREWVTFSTKWPVGSISGDDFAANAVTAAKIPNRERYLIKDAGQLEEASADAATWTPGGSYDYWSFAKDVLNIVWLYDNIPYDLAGNYLSVYLWTIPNANGAGGGAENVRWEFEYSVTSNNRTLSTVTGAILVDQQARVNTTAYRDLLTLLPTDGVSKLISLKISRAGANGTDTYDNTMRLIGVEIAYTANT